MEITLGTQPTAVLWNRKLHYLTEDPVYHTTYQTITMQSWHFPSSTLTDTKESHDARWVNDSFDLNYFQSASQACLWPLQLPQPKLPI